MSGTINLEQGDDAPLFSALDSQGENHNLTEILATGKSVILYFYPRDSTPGCTEHNKIAFASF